MRNEHIPTYAYFCHDETLPLSWVRVRAHRTNPSHLCRTVCHAQDRCNALAHAALCLAKCATTSGAGPLGCNGHAGIHSQPSGGVMHCSMCSLAVAILHDVLEQCPQQLHITLLQACTEFATKNNA
jgi:hypothetical protein